MSAHRHACLGCGRSCVGVNVRAIDDDEAARMTELGAQLGVADVWEDGRLRRVDDACVFLGADRLCRVHGAFGADAKPWACRQYPVVAVHTEAGPRVAIDPGCYLHALTWRTAEPAALGRLRGGKVELSAAAAADEARVLAQFTEAASLAAALRGLVDADGPLPASWRAEVARWATSADLEPVFALPGLGPAVGEALRPALARWARGEPSDAVAAEDWLVDAVRRAVALRGLSALGSPSVAALLLGVGATLAGGAGDERAAGEAFAAWFRALRTRPLVSALLPDAAALGRWLAALRGP